jgi:hypothetical protein
VFAQKTLMPPALQAIHLTCPDVFIRIITSEGNVLCGFLCL